MKKIILILLFLPETLLLAQNTNNTAIEPIGESKFSMGVKGGFGHSYIMPYSNNIFKSSADIGLAMMFAPWEHLGIGLDGLYSSEGVILKTGDYKSTTQLDYFRVPLKLTWFFRQYEHDLRPKIAIGPSLGLLLNQDKNPGFSALDVGAVASLGFNYRLLEAFWLTLDGNYFHGFSDVYKDNEENDRNGNIRLNVGLMVGF